MFQFHKGTSKTHHRDWAVGLQLRFNSIKVRVKLRPLIDIRDGLHSFNSIKVRVKHMRNGIERSGLLFQFHKGTSKTPNCLTCATRSGSFNSIKVRVKPHQFQGRRRVLRQFQFHKGTSKTFGRFQQQVLHKDVSIP